MGVLFGTEICQYWRENNAKFFAVMSNHKKIIHENLCPQKLIKWVCRFMHVP